MSGHGDPREDDPLADALAAYDDLLAVGGETPPEALHEAVDPALVPEWNRLATFLSLVEKAWPRDAGAAATDPPAASRDAETTGYFGRFRILRTLGQGGFGIVFLAWDPALRRQVALKVPQPEALVTPEARKRFLREARAAAGLDHPNIVPMYETGSVGTVTYIASAYCSGPTLAGWLDRRGGPVPVREAAGLVAALARAVEHAHERGVLHRDLKPSNVLLQGPREEPSGAEEARPIAAFRPRITDFSLAWLADGEGPKTLSGFPFGSPPYMAPEQAEGRLKVIGPPTDVYGLGCILYELLVGHPPFRGAGQIEIMRRVIADDPLPPRRLRREVPAALEAIVLKCLAKDPARRYPVARELADDLDRWLAGEPTRARPIGRWEKVTRSARRHPAALIVVAISAAFVGALLIGGRWYADRLEQSRQLARQREEDARRNELDSRHARYVADVRRAGLLSRDQKRNMAMALLERNRPRSGETDLREFSWSLLRRRCNTERLILTGHRGEVYHVEFSPDGRSLASSGQDGTVRLWDPATGAPIRSFQAHKLDVNWVAFSPDGKTLATASDDGAVRVWDAATGGQRLDLPAHRGIALIVLFTPDGRRLVSCGREDGDVKAWEFATGRLLGSLHADDALLENMAISPDGRTLAVVSQSSNAGLWDLATHHRIGSLGPHGGGVPGVAFSHDGARLATGSGVIARLWERDSCSLVRELSGHPLGIQSVAFSNDDRTLVSADDDGTIRIWDVATGVLRGVHLGHGNRIWGVAISPDGRMIASASRDGMVKLWDCRPPQIPTRLVVEDRLNALAFSADGQALITASGSGNISKRHPRTGKSRETWRLGDPRSIEGVVLDRRGSVAAARRKDGFIEIHDLRSQRLAGTIATTASHLDRLEFDPEGRHLVVAEGTRGVSLWDIRRLNRLAFFEGSDIGRAVFGPQGRIYCIPEVESNGTIIWDSASGESNRVRPGWAPWDFACSSPDGTVLATTHDAHSFIRSPDSLECLATLEGHTHRVDTLAFSPDARTLASGDGGGMIMLWDVVAREVLLTLEPHSGPVRSIGFSPNGQTLASCADRPDGTSEVFLWHAAGNDMDRAAPDPDRSGGRER